MVILASSSPRRQELIKELYDDFKVIVPQIDEDIEIRNPKKLPRVLSALKAVDVGISRNREKDVIIGCDTIVLFKGNILGKPHNQEEAFAMLKALSGQSHLVISGYSICHNNIITTKSVTSKVTFSEISDEQIMTYIATGSPFDKAGGYGIQDENFPYVKKIRGSKNNVIGFPIEQIKKTLNKLGLKTK